MIPTPRERIEALEQEQTDRRCCELGISVEDLAWLLAIARAAVAWREAVKDAQARSGVAWDTVHDCANVLIAAVDGTDAGTK